MKCKLFVNDKSKPKRYIVVRSDIKCPKGYYSVTFDDLQTRDNMVSDLISEGYEDAKYV